MTARAGVETIGVETIGLTMRFGAFTALDAVSLKVRPGSFHALLGENGAGKSTLVKCIMGFNRPTAGSILVGDREAAIPDPRAAHALGLGMVYQHFTLAGALTAAENLVISRDDPPGIVNWAKERAALDAFMDRMPFRAPLDVPVNRLAAGERQKLELLKQLYLGRRFLILDEPTSVLTPSEADELLGMVRGLTETDGLTVLMITHKFREVTAFADTVSVLRRGRYVGGGTVADLDHGAMAEMMIGDRQIAPKTGRTGALGAPVLQLEGVNAADRSGLKEIAIDELTASGGEIVGVAGISGNGQTELVEILAGQRPLRAGGIRVNGKPYGATRAEARAARVRYLPEEPLRNACAPAMSVAENISFHDFDIQPDGARRFWLRPAAMTRHAAALAAAFKVSMASIDSPIASLSGGNVQRAVLARELSGDVDLLIVANPCFGLDFSAVAEIRARIMAARNAGAAVLLFSEDLDEILELSDRILVMSEGRIVFETEGASADMALIGQHMAGHA